MSVAAQLRLAIAVLIVALAAILAAAFYVPKQLQDSAKQRYVRDAIPLRTYVLDLRFQLAAQEAAMQSYLLTADESRLQRYESRTLAVNYDLRRIAEHPEMRPLVRRATRQIGDLQLLYLRQRTLVRRTKTRAELVARGRDVTVAFASFRQTTAQMLEQTNAIIASADAEQDRTYRQLLVALAALGSIALAIGVVLFVLMPRRFGQLYAAERRSRVEAESRADAARALAHVSDGVVLTDESGRIRFWNPAAAKLTGIDDAGAVGRELARLLPGWERLTQHADADSTLGGAAVFPIQLGHERWLSVTSVDFGEGVVYAIRDVTEERGLERLRTEFVATASHELRTPMTSISGAARTLLRRGSELTESRRTSFLEMIVSESDRLARIVDQILVASRIEAGAIDVVREPCDGAAIARSVVETARLRAPEGVGLAVEAPDDLPLVDCDGDRLRQVLGNLVDNAIKYSPGGGDVRVELSNNGDDTVQFAVHDEGLGFDRSAAESIFERFRRLDPHLTHGIGGTGLGLYISRELVRRMGGRIWAESEPGEGASFYVELAVAQDAVGSAQHFGTAG